MANKSAIDISKENQEEEVLQSAIRVSKTKKKLTRDILSFMDGTEMPREKKDRPDIVKMVSKRMPAECEELIGIEHFLVDQVSISQNGRRKSVAKEKEKYIEKLIGYSKQVGYEELKLQKIQEEINNTIFDIASNTNYSGINELKESFRAAFEKHLEKVNEYNENMLRLADGRPFKLAFLIEIHCNADDVYLNNGKSVRRRKNDIYPVLNWMVEELEKINPSLVQYVVLYMRNSLNKQIEDVIAIETDNIRGSLRKQGIPIYDYCDDPARVSFKRTGMAEKGLEYTSEIDTEEFGENLVPSLKQAYSHKRKSVPFVAPRAIQIMMKAFGKASFREDASGLKVISEFDIEETLRRFDATSAEYPNR